MLLDVGMMMMVDEGGSWGWERWMEMMMREGFWWWWCVRRVRPWWSEWKNWGGLWVGEREGMIDDDGEAWWWCGWWRMVRETWEGVGREIGFGLIEKGFYNYGIRVFFFLLDSFSCKSFNSFSGGNSKSSPNKFLWKYIFHNSLFLDQLDNSAKILQSILIFYVFSCSLTLLMHNLKTYKIK